MSIRHLRRLAAWSIAVVTSLAILPHTGHRASGQMTAPGLVAAVLPSARSGVIGAPVTAFVSVVNTGPATVDGVGVFLRTPVPATLVFQATDSSTNLPTGAPGVLPAAPASESGDYVRDRETQPRVPPPIHWTRVDGNRLMRGLTVIQGDSRVAAPLLRGDPGASTALALIGPRSKLPHAARSMSRARTCAGV